jgi:hypothetical protein
MELLHELLTEQMLDRAKRDKVQETKDIHEWGRRTEVSGFKVFPGGCNQEQQFIML